MKYAITVFKDSINIGDDIQSYAAMKQLPKVDYFIEREHMNEFIPEDKKKVKTLINGWYIHNRYRFPPSPYIIPFFTSCHFSSLDDMYGVTTEYMEDYAAEYMRRYEPIGCRDKVTETLLSNNGIKTYRSHCLTLTIPKIEGIKKEKKIILVDVSEKIKEKVKETYDGEIKEITHSLDKNKNSKLSYEERMNNVENLLKEYQGAEMVITTRLHCALPNLALEVPVLLIFDDNNYDVVSRIGDFRKLLDYCSEEEFLQGGLEKYFIKAPKKKHLKIRKDLINRIHQFINEKPLVSKLDMEEEFVKNNHRINKLVKIYQTNLYEEREKRFAREQELTNMTYAKEYWEKEYHHLLELYEKEKSKNSSRVKNIIRRGIAKIKKEKK